MMREALINLFALASPFTQRQDGDGGPVQRGGDQGGCGSLFRLKMSRESGLSLLGCRSFAQDRRLRCAFLPAHIDAPRFKLSPFLSASVRQRPNPSATRSSLKLWD
ncbi:parvalbumin alpha isoform X4 [Dermochelys coriacea]|uniref:parvalbumin alpha isoform X4 n=1 Tax=Dermochelys coriacea TaxID=27794 RepID=UPI001CA94ECB|nr:parvalbumin alpha isoform X4 [Dermochelys coriacea]